MRTVAAQSASLLTSLLATYDIYQEMASPLLCIKERIFVPKEKMGEVFPAVFMYTSSNEHT
jgi:hypothetical protein